MSVHFPKFFAPGGMEFPLLLLAAAVALLIEEGGYASVDARLQNRIPADRTGLAT